MASSFREPLLQRLPLPLAQMYGRANNTRTVLQLHQTAYYLWEVALKLLGASAIVAYAERERTDPLVEERLRSLSRPSLGHWWEFIRRLVPVLADDGDAGFIAVRDLVLGRTRDDLPRAAGLDAALLEALEERTAPRSQVRVSELFDRLVQYRNREMGHGAAGQRPAAFYERMGRALLAGVPELLGKLDVLAGRRLVYVAALHGRPDDAWQVERSDLTGAAAHLLESLVLADASAGHLPRPERLYLEAADGRLIGLYPLVHYEADTGEVLFYSARKGRSRAEYLCYTSGRTDERGDLAGERRTVLARSLGLMEEATAAPTPEAPLAESEPAPPAATRQLGDFELLSKLGQGGMGVVYRAWQPSLGRQVALKCLHNTGDTQAEARFAREIRALARAEHPHLVRIFTSGSDGEKWFYAMELVEGATLAAVCDRLHSHTANPTTVDWHTWTETVSTACLEARQTEKPLGEARRALVGHGSEPHLHAVPTEQRDYVRHIVELVRQVAQAAHALHDVGVVHRDIKPGNVMLTPDGNHAVLTDLGLAQLSDEVAGKLTRTRQFVGTLRYASPEQVLAVGSVDRRSDVYSLGVTLWELLTLRPMYEADEQTPTPELMRRIQYAEPDSPRRHNPRVSRDLEAVILKCLEKDARRRYGTAADLADDLGRVLAREPVQARPVGWLRRNLRRLKRRRRRALSAAGLVLSLLAATAGWWYWDANYRPKVEYFADYTKRWGAMEGVCPLSAQEVRRRNRSYRITHRGGRVEKFEMVNGQGRRRPLPLFTYIEDISHDAAGRPEHQLEFVRNANGEVVQEVARDQSGEIVWILHYTTPALGHFTDRNGFPRARSASGAAYVQIERDANGFDAGIRYLSADGRPLAGQDATFGFRVTNDERGLPSEILFLGPQDQPAANRQGIARVSIRRDAQGNRVETAYWDANGQPTREEAGGSRYLFAYDEHGNLILWECFGPDGQLVLSSHKFARSHRRYDELGNLVEWWCEDEHGRPVRGKDGHARERIVPDEHGNWAEVYYADEEGKPTRDRYGIAGSKARFDDKDQLIEVRYLDERGQPTRHNSGNAGFTARFDKRGNRIELTYFDEQDRPAWHKNGYVRSTARYDERGNKIEESYFNADGQLTRCRNGFARWTAEYDDGGNCITKHYWNGQGQPTPHVDGNTGYSDRFDERGNRIERIYRNAAGRPARIKEGYARVQSGYNEHGDHSEEAYFDEAGKPVLCRDGYFRRTVAYNERGNVVKVAYFGREGEPIRSHGAASYTAKYDDRGNRIEEAYWDEFGRPTAFRKGYARCEMKYDRRDNQLEVVYYDEQNRLTRTPLGHARLKMRYDERDRLVEKAFWDEMGEPAPLVPDGNVRSRVRYDERGNNIEESYYDRDGKLTRVRSSGVARVTSKYDTLGNRIAVSYWDERGQPTPHGTGGNAGLTSKYDERGNCVERTFLDKEGKPIRLKDGGNARFTARYDERGHCVEQAFWDERGQPVEHHDGYYRFTSQYDDRGNQIELIYFGRDGRRGRFKDSYSRLTARYNERDNRVETVYFDEEDRLVRGPDGYARWLVDYDDRGRPKAASVFDADGAPMRIRACITEVVPGSQGARLGLCKGDILLTYDGREIPDTLQFIQGRKGEKPTDAPRELRLRRDRETLTIKVRPGLIGIGIGDRAFREDEAKR
jgi:YD repeat-containing protein